MSVIELVKPYLNSQHIPSLERFGEFNSEAEINKLQNSFDIKLPEDYKELLLTLGAVSLTGEFTNYTSFTPSEILNNELHDISINLGNVLPIASDDSGQYYFYDIDNKSGKGIMSIGLIDTGNISWKYVVMVGVSLTETLKKIIEGECFDEYEYLEAKR